MTGFRVAYYFAASTGALLEILPFVASAQAITPERRWDLPTDVDVIFAPPDFGDLGAHNAPRPAGWPGKVRFVQIASSGTDGYPQWMFDGPVVATAAGTAAPPIAEYVLTAMLMHEKRLPAMFARAGDPPVTQSDLMAKPLGSLDGQTLGLLGVGHIGTAVAKLAVAFGMNVIAHRRTSAAAPDPAMTLVAFDDLLARPDHSRGCGPCRAADTRNRGSDRDGRAGEGQARRPYRQHRPRRVDRPGRADRCARPRPGRGCDTRRHRSRTAARKRPVVAGSERPHHRSRLVELGRDPAPHLRAVRRQPRTVRQR
jgi:hypothetical protein